MCCKISLLIYQASNLSSAVKYLKYELQQTPKGPKNWVLVAILYFSKIDFPVG